MGVLEMGDVGVKLSEEAIVLNDVLLKALEKMDAGEPLGRRETEEVIGVLISLELERLIEKGN